ncbi:uncharacterized protein LOC125512748 [Triticum urartu]|uniref:uncharacterized protein LOC125512724 n=1 Tax=Triticum urartu TaxID=4572 RepID=UPI0020446ECB|nr:uncharacterized protein LOC125512724 [Triticum urartu]XP_048533798.1 uncharacterized protein LOC125512748 [Triticum urartu]
MCSMLCRYQTIIKQGQAVGIHVDLRFIAPGYDVRAIMADASENCGKDIMKEFSKHITGQLWRAEAMMLLNAIFAGVIVGIGAFGHRYRHYGFTRYLLLGQPPCSYPSYLMSSPHMAPRVMRLISLPNVNW